MERKHIIRTRYFSDVRCLLQCLTIPSTLGAVPFFILAATAWAAIPLLAAIVLDVTPEAHRGFFKGAIVTLATLPGFLAPFVTGLLVQAAGNDASQGLHHAYVLAAVLLLVCGVLFTIVVRPDEAIRTLKALGSAPERA